MKKNILKIKQLNYDSNLPFDAHCLYGFPSENSGLKQSIFSYSGINKFIHFTSFESCYKILSDGYMYMSALSNLEDQSELEYGSNVLKLYPYDSSKRKQAKSEIFSFSMCVPYYLKMKDYKYMWNKYGENNSGVAIIFEFVNSPLKWYNYYLSWVYYSFEILKKNIIYPKNGRYNYYDIILSAFLKDKKFRNENEVRLIFDSRESTKLYNKYNELIYPKFIEIEDKKFHGLLLANKFKTQYIPNLEKKPFEMPMIKITDVILGVKSFEANKRFIKEIDSSIRVSKRMI